MLLVLGRWVKPAHYSIYMHVDGQCRKNKGPVLEAAAVCVCVCVCV